MSAVLSPLARFESAGRSLRGLMAWWGAGLAAWLPAGWRQALAASTDRLLLQVQGEGLQLRRQAGGGLQDVASLPVPKKARKTKK